MEKKQRKETAMMKKIFMMFVMAALVFGVTALAFSAGDGNDRKGKYTFRKSCRTCHIENGSAKPLSPDSKTMKQWERIFDGDKYQKLACKTEWETLTQEQRNDIFAYLYKHAFDSPTPAKCK